MGYDSRADTLQHILRVQQLIHAFVIELLKRADKHDASKLEEPEKPLLDRLTPKLRGTTYGSKEYQALLEELRPALEHHYRVNPHHPEHYPNGIAGMSLLDLVEMLADWAAATERHADGDLARSLQINRERFQISEQLAQILENTARELGWLNDGRMG